MGVELGVVHEVHPGVAIRQALVAGILARMLAIEHVPVAALPRVFGPDVEMPLLPLGHTQLD